MSTVHMEVLRSDPGEPSAGEVFTFLMPESKHCFGRVVRTDAVWSLQDEPADAILAYIYAVVRSSKEMPELEELRPTRLMTPPLLMSRELWSAGYFETLANIPLGDGDLMARHSFREEGPHETTFDTWHYRDEFGQKVTLPLEPVGELRLWTAPRFNHLMLQRLQMRELARACEAELKAAGEWD